MTHIVGFQQATLIKFSKQKLPPPTRTRKSALAPPPPRGRPAAARAGAAASAFVFLPVSEGLPITLSVACGRHATVLTLFHAGGGFRCG